MIDHKHQLRVRYADTDQMGYVYYGNYPRYFEAGRAEMIRDFGLTYREIEEMGVLMPVAEMQIRYFRPARYDDLLTIRSIIREMPDRRMVVEAEVYNEEGKLLTTSTIKLAFLDARTMKPTRIPEVFRKVVEENWEEEESA